MIRVQVSRGAADKEAPEIINELMTQEICAREHGRNYLDENGFSKSNFDLELPFRDVPLPGKTALVSDAEISTTFKGKITGWTINVNNMDDKKPVKIRTDISIERSLT